MEKWERIELFNDTDELASGLLTIAPSLDPAQAYFLREAAENLTGLWQLCLELRDEMFIFGDELGLFQEQQNKKIESLLSAIPKWDSPYPDK